MQRSDWERRKFLWLLAVLRTAALCRTATSASRASVTAVPVGETVRFPIHYSSDEKYEVTLYRKSPTHLKILTWMSEDPETLHVLPTSYEKRVHFQREAFIELQDVRLSDRGKYEMQTNYFGRELRSRDREQFELCVFDLVSKPVVVITRNSSHLTLSCSAVSSSSITYRWERWTDTGVGNSTFHGAVLHLLDNGQACHTYTCIAQDLCIRQSSHPVPAELLHVDPARGSWRNRVFVLIPVVLIPVVLGILHQLRKSAPSCERLSPSASSPQPAPRILDGTDVEPGDQDVLYNRRHRDLSVTELSGRVSDPPVFSQEVEVLGNLQQPVNPLALHVFRKLEHPTDVRTDGTGVTESYSTETGPSSPCRQGALPASPKFLPSAHIPPSPVPPCIYPSAS